MLAGILYPRHPLVEKAKVIDVPKSKSCYVLRDVDSDARVKWGIRDSLS